MSTTDNTAALQSIIDALTSGTPLTISTGSNADGSVTFTVQPQQNKPQPVPIPPIGPLPIPAPQPMTPAPVPPPASTASQFTSVTHPMAIPSTLKTPFPHPTNAWWENIILGKNRIAPDPYQVQVVDNGMLVCYPSQYFSVDSQNMQHITTQWLQNFSLEFSENIGSWAVVAYDELTVTLKWIASNGQSATSVIAQGCPYMSMSYTGTTPLLTSQHAILSINEYTTSGNYTGNTFKIALNNGQTWKLYCSQSLSFTWSGGQLMASAPFTGMVRLAILLNAGDEAILDQCVSAIPTSSTISTSFSGSTATYTFTWNVTGSGPLLMCALPHHMDILQSPQTVNLQRQSIKGPMIGIVGNSWALVETLPSITWAASKPINPTKLDAIKAQLKKDAAFVANSTSDTYFAGKGLAKAARLLLIAAEIGDTDSQALIQKNLKASLTAWFTTPNLFAYDQTWGGIVFVPALSNSGADFGFSHDWNDHVFHLSYYVYACAVLARFDTQWAATYGGKITELMHDYCNPIGSSDLRYPFIRNKDIFSGHCWASGIVDFADNRNLESTSEAINGFYGAMLWGVATGDTALQNFVGLMLAMEIRSAIAYWHNARKYHTPQWTEASATINWSTKLDGASWFSALLECRRGIQILPITPMSEAYLDVPFVQYMVSSGEMATMLAQAAPEWRGIILASLAVVDPVTAWSQAQALTAYDDGNSASNLWHFIATR